MPKPVGERFTYFSDDQRAEFLAGYTGSNNAVQRRFFKDREKPIFPEPVSMSKVVELVPETVDPIVDLIVHLSTSAETSSDPKKVGKILGIFKRPKRAAVR